MIYFIATKSHKNVRWYSHFTLLYFDKDLKFASVFPIKNFIIFMLHIYVTGFWKTNRNVTLGLFYFIGPTNGYTFTLHIYSSITRLGWLVCFSRKSFVDSVNLQLRQWDPWRALHGRHGSEIHLSDRETSLRPST